MACWAVQDFNMAHAAPLLERYRDTHLVFNDDIQGTATCAVGGVYGAMAVQGTLLSYTVATDNLSGPITGVKSAEKRTYLLANMVSPELKSRFGQVNASL